MNKNYLKLSIIVNVALYFVIVATWISIPDEHTLNIGLTLFNLLITTVLLVIKRESFKVFYTSTYFKNFAATFFSAILILGIIGFVNFLAYKNTLQVDLSKNLNNTLTDQTLKVIKKIEKTVDIKIFAPKSDSAHYKALMNLYFYENNNFNIEVIDPTIRPDLVQTYGITKSGTIVIEYLNKRQLVTETSELNITNALIKLTREKTPYIYILTGHAEMSFLDESPEGFSSMQKKIINSAYSIESVDLKTKDKVPDYVDVILIWGPKRDFMKKELSIVEEFVKKGGSLIVGLDPNLNELTLPGLRKLLRSFSIEVSNDLVIDLKSHIDGSQGTVPLVTRFNKQNKITSEMKESVFLPVASSVRYIKNKEIKGENLIESSPFPGSWAEKNPKELIDGSLKFSEGVDSMGPVGLGVSVKLKNDSRIIAFGNSNFVANKYVKFASNYVMFLNSLAWLVSDDELISFNLPSVENEPVFIGKPQVGIIFYFSVVFVPIILIGFAIFIYRRRLKL